jgi:hypothetical protein
VITFDEQDVMRGELKPFHALVEEDATSFLPMGTKVHSYTRQTADSKGKNTAGASAMNDKSVEYEVYHVCPSNSHLRNSTLLIQIVRLAGIRPVSASIIGECNFSFYST